MVLGTSLAYGANASIFDALRFLLGSFLASGAGLAARGTSHVTSSASCVGLILGAALCLLSWLVLQSPLRLGPEISLPSYIWIGVCAVIGFLSFWPEDVERGPFPAKTDSTLKRKRAAPAGRWPIQAQPSKRNVTLSPSLRPAQASCSISLLRNRSSFSSIRAMSSLKTSLRSPACSGTLNLVR